MTFFPTSVAQACSGFAAYAGNSQKSLQKSGHFVKYGLQLWQGSCAKNMGGVGSAHLASAHFGSRGRS